MTVAILLLACLVLAGAVAVLAAGLKQLRTGLTAELAAVRAELGSLRDRGLVTDAGAPPSPGEKAEYVITRLGDEPDPEPVPTLEPRLFADTVLRESVVKAASFVHGVRRGLSPANRNRIWFEVRREVKRARKQRKAEEREAVRQWRARQRAALREDDAA